MTTRPRSEGLFLMTCESKDKRRKVEDECDDDECEGEGMALDRAGTQWDNGACRDHAAPARLACTEGSRRRVPASRPAAGCADVHMLAQGLARCWAAPSANLACDDQVCEK